MFLVARLFALCLYVMFLLSAYYFIAQGTRKIIRNTLIVYLLCLCIVAYLYEPMTSADLYRLIPIMNGYAAKSFGEVLGIIATQSLSTPGVPILYYIVGQVGKDGALACAAALITYGFVFSILYDCYLKNHIKSRDLALVLLLFMSRGIFLIVISNVRTGISLAIIAWCVYHEIVNHRNIFKDVPFYIVAASIHSLGQAVIILRIILVLTETNNGRISVKKCISFVAFMALIIVFGTKFGFFEQLLGKTDSYYEKSVNDEGYYYIWEVIFNYYALAIYYYLVRCRKRMCKDGLIYSSATTNQLFRFFKLLIAIDAIAYFVEYNFFYRLGWFVAILAIPTSLLLLKETENTRMHASLHNFILVSSIILLFLECARGDLCGLKLW